MLQHLKGYQRSITLIKTGRLNKKNNTNINTNTAHNLMPCFISPRSKAGKANQQFWCPLKGRGVKWLHFAIGV